VDTVGCRTLFSWLIGLFVVDISKFLVGATTFIMWLCSRWQPPVYVRYLKFSQNFFYGD
jgi:hypothetical protein